MLGKTLKAVGAGILIIAVGVGHAAAAAGKGASRSASAIQRNAPRNINLAPASRGFTNYQRDQERQKRTSSGFPALK
jgi:hypothetical protein